MPLINCEVSLTLTWSENCVLTDITTKTARNANPNANPPVEAGLPINAPTNATFEIKDVNCMYRLLLYRLKMIRNFWNN